MIVSQRQSPIALWMIIEVEKPSKRVAGVLLSDQLSSRAGAYHCGSAEIWPRAMSFCTTLAYALSASQNCDIFLTNN